MNNGYIAQIEGYEGINVSSPAEKFVWFIQNIDHIINNAGESVKKLSAQKLLALFNESCVYTPKRVRERIEQERRRRSIPAEMEDHIVKWCAEHPVKSQVDALFNAPMIPFEKMFKNGVNTINWIQFLTDKGYPEDFIKGALDVKRDSVGSGEFLMQFVIEGGRQVESSETEDGVHGDIVVGDYSMEIKAPKKSSAGLSRAAVDNTQSFGENATNDMRDCLKACGCTNLPKRINPFPRGDKRNSTSTVYLDYYVNEQAKEHGMDETWIKETLQKCIDTVFAYFQEKYECKFFKDEQGRVLLNMTLMEKELLPVRLRRYVGESRDMIFAVFQENGDCDYLYPEDFAEGVLEQKLENMHFSLSFPTVTEKSGRGFVFGVQKKQKGN